MESGIVLNIFFCMILFVGVMITMMGLPGNVLIVIVGISYGYYENFAHIDYATLVIIIGAFVISELIEFVAGILGAKKEKASKRGMVAAFVGTILGSIGGTMILPVLGTLLGAFAGAAVSTILAEYSKTKDIQLAKRVGIGAVKGQIVGMIIKVVTAIGMASVLFYQLNWPE